MATTTNQTIEEVITRSKTEGFERSRREAELLDEELNQVVKTGDKLAKAQISNARAQEQFNRRYEEGYRVAREFAKQQEVLQKSLEMGRFGEGAAAVDEYNRKLELLRKATIDVGADNDNLIRSTQKVSNQFGLARHQVQNLTAQFVDFGVQLGSGGGILLPLIQQGPQAVDAMGGLGKAVNIAKQAFAGLSTTTKGLLIGGAGVTVFGLAAKGVLDFSRALGELTQAQRVSEAVDRVAEAHKNLAQQFDLFAGRPSNLYIDAVNAMAAALQGLAGWLNRTRQEQENLTAAQVQGRSVAQQMVAGPPPITAQQGIYTQTPTALNREYGGKTFALPGPSIGGLPGTIMGRQSVYESPQLPGTLGTGGAEGMEGRKDLIDGVETGIRQGFKEAGFQEQPSKFGEQFGRVWVPVTKESDRSNREGLSDVERAIGGVEGAVARWGYVNQQAIDAMKSLAASAAAGGGAGRAYTDYTTANDYGSFADAFGDYGDTLRGGSAAGQLGRGSATYSFDQPMRPYLRYTPRGYALQFIPNEARSGQLAPGMSLAGTQAVGGTAATAPDLSSLDPIGRLIESLRQQQTATMQRAYTPDPYSDKNADWFYSGGRMYAAEQDKIFTGIQAQIDQLAELQTLAQKQVEQGAALPQALADAMVEAMAKAGMTATDIARVLAGLKPASPTGSTQAGALPNRYGATPGRSTVRSW